MSLAPRKINSIATRDFELVTMARTWLILNEPFFGSLIMKLKLEEANIKTAATDGKRILYAVEYILTLSKKECIGLFAHEVMHCVLRHMFRIGNKDPAVWNAACDYVINIILNKSDFILPRGALLDYKFADMTAEEVYELLIKDEQAVQNIKNSTPMDWIFQNDSSSEQADIQIDWEIDIEIATERAKAAGKLPGAVESALGKFEKPQIDWKVALQRFFTGYAQNDYCWARPRKRLLYQGFYLPSLYSEELEDVILGIDTSGSVTDKELSHVGGEVSLILNSFKCNIIVVYCDSVVQGVKKFDSSELPQDFGHDFPGRGGTRLQPIFDYVTKEGLNPSCMVYFTDGGICDRPNPPDYPLLTITTGSPIDIGDNIKYAINNKNTR